MKFTTPFIVLFSAAYVLGFENTNYCIDEMETKYPECFLKKPFSCTAEELEKCKNLFDNYNSILPSCQSLSQASINEINRISINRRYNILTTLCNTKDENNNFCPIVSSFMENVDRASIELVNKIINDTCKSEACRKKTFELYLTSAGNSGEARLTPEEEEYLNKFVIDKDFDSTLYDDGLTIFLYLLSFLRSDYCASKSINANANTNTNTNTGINTNANTNTTTNANINTNVNANTTTDTNVNLISNDASTIKYETLLFTIILSLLCVLL